MWFWQFVFILVVYISHPQSFPTHYSNTVPSKFLFTLFNFYFINSLFLTLLRYNWFTMFLQCFEHINCRYLNVSWMNDSWEQFIAKYLSSLTHRWIISIPFLPFRWEAENELTCFRKIILSMITFKKTRFIKPVILQLS